MTERQYGQRSVMFADGAKGMKLQLYKIFEIPIDGGPPIDTGIHEAASKKNSNAPWVSRFERNDKEFPDLKSAIADYEASQ